MTTIDTTPTSDDDSDGTCTVCNESFDYAYSKAVRQPIPEDARVCIALESEWAYIHVESGA